MSLSASRRTWEEASSPAAVRLARDYEQAWRDSKPSDRRPDPQAFLDAAGASAGGPGARLALLRADLSLRWEAGDKAGARGYLDRHADLSEDTIVALVYEEFCLLEDDDQQPDPASFLARFPEVSPALRRVLDIHGLVGSGSSMGGSLIGGNGSGEHACEFPEAGQTIAGFSLVEELGRGAFARVFLARERDLADRPVALKVTRRGSREPQTLARLQHTHIVPVHSHRNDKATGLHLLCMPYFGRTTLAQVLADARKRATRSGAGLVESLDRLEPRPDGAAGGSSGRAALERRSHDRAIAWWGTRLAEALDHAHERGVLHRDIKPSNVLVTSDGMPMLLDFNLAREPLNDDGQAADAAPGGTVDYMAPEHLRALLNGDPEGLDNRSDIYSLGVVLYEALTGCRPFEPPRRGASLVEALQRTADDRYRPSAPPRSIEPGIAPALDAVVRRCLEPEPFDRYQSAAELAADLRAVADDLPLPFGREPWSSRAAGWLRRKRRKLMVAAALASALILATVTILVAAIGYLLIKVDESEIVEARLRQARVSLDKEDYVTAFAQYEAIKDLASHFGRLDPRNYPGQGRGFTGSVAAIYQKLRSLRAARDLDDMRATANVKGKVAELHAKVSRDANALHNAADRLRFRLLLDPKDLPALSIELSQAIQPFYVLQRTDWTELDFALGILGDDQKAQLKDEVNELLFLWVATIDYSLSTAAREAADPGADDRERLVIASAVDICNRALAFAVPRAPWLALRARLTRPHRCDDVDLAESRAEVFFEGEPRDIESEHSALASFQWALLGSAAGRPAGYIPARSIEWMRHAVRLRGDDYWYQFFLANVLDGAGIYDEALVHYSLAAALRPDSPWVRYSRARLYRSKGKWRDALDDFDVAMRELSDRPEARIIDLEQGYLYQAMGHIADARRAYDRVIEADAADDFGLAARLNRANLDADSGQLDRALAAYDAILKEEPRDTAVRLSRAILELRMGQPSLAERDLTALLEFGRPGMKHRGEYLSERAQARLLLGRAADAMADAVEARRIHPCPAHDRLAQRTFLAARRYDLLQLDRPENLAMFPRGGRRLEADLRDAAADLARHAAGRDERAFRAGLNRAAILAALGDPRAAIAAADRAAALSPFATEARLLRARVRSFAGDRRGAAAEVQAALVNRPDDPGLLELRAALRLAGSDPRGAIEDYDRVLANGPRDGIHRGKAAALCALGDYHAAVDQWSLALRRDPELPEAYLGRAQTYFLLGQWDQGMADLEQAAAWAHGDPRIEVAVASAYLRCLPLKPDRLPRLLVHIRRAAGDFWQSVDGRYHLAAGIQ